MQHNNKPEKTLSNVIFGFLFQLLIFYVINKINRPSKFTTLIVILIGLLLVKSGLGNLHSVDLGYLMGGIALIAWVLYRNLYPKENTPSPLQEITSAFSQIKQEMRQDQKAAEAQGVPVKDYLRKKYAVVNANEIKAMSINTLLFGLAITMAFMAVGIYMLKEEWRLNHEFLETTCKILDKQMLTTDKKHTTHYQANFYLSYQAANQTITKWAFSTPQSPSTISSYLAERTLNKFAKGQTYACWFDPNDFHKVALERGYGFFPMLFFFVSFGVFVLLALVVVKKYKLTNNLSRYKNSQSEKIL